jgi:hypothetical protein
MIPTSGHVNGHGNGSTHCNSSGPHSNHSSHGSHGQW